VANSNKGDKGAINLAAQILLKDLFGMSAQGLDEYGERIFQALTKVVAKYWRAFDTPEMLAERVARLFPPQPDFRPPWEGPEGAGWTALMEAMSESDVQTSPLA